MTIARMIFSPPDGLCDMEHYPTTPESESQARAHIQSMSNQLRDYINDTLLLALESKAAGQSGAERIGSAAIDSVFGDTVYAQIADIKAQIDNIVAGSVADGTITEHKLAAGAVSQAKLAADAVSENKIQDGAVTAGKIGAGAVTAAKIGAGAVSKSKLGADVLAWTLVVQSDAIAGSGNVPMASQAGKSEMMIQLRSADGNIGYATMIAPLDAQGRTLPSTNVMYTYFAGDFTFDYRMITVNQTSIGYTAARAETLGGTSSLKRIYVFVR